MNATSTTIDTPRGPARAHVARPGPGAPSDPRALVLGHGAGGGVTAVDLQAAAAVALERGLAVALVEQPYRVAGRGSPPAAPVLDEAWRVVVADLRRDALAGRQLICGGRSSGARVACRTAAATGAAGVLCLAFPLLAPARRDGSRPDRGPELAAVRVPVLVVQGRRDRFGIPGAAPGREVVVLDGDHALRADLPGLRAALGRWLDTLGR